MADHPEKLRLFVGSPPDEPIRDILQSLYADREQVRLAGEGGLRWVRPENWHLTWLFIGEVAADRLPAIEHRLRDALPVFQSPETIITRPAVWPHAKRPAALVLPVEATEPVAAMAGRIRLTLPAYDDGKPFRPHITLARFGRRARTCPDLSAPPFCGLPDKIPFRIEAVNLYHSKLTSGGPIYKCLLHMPL